MTMFGLFCCCCCCCAAAGRLPIIPAAKSAGKASHGFRITFMEDLLTFRLGGGDRATPHGIALLKTRQALRLKAGCNHAGLVHVRTLHILRLAPARLRVLPMCLCNAPTYRRIACPALLRRLRGRLWACEHHGNARPPVGRATTSWSCSWPVSSV